MLIKTLPGWGLSERAVTPESQYVDRRQLAKGLAAGSLLAATPLGNLAAAEEPPTADLYPAPRKEALSVEFSVTKKSITGTHNNFYEFGSHKNIWQAAQDLSITPWNVTIDGLVEKKIHIEAEDLIRRMPLEERITRHRCVEAWAMTIPWTGFPLARLVEFARPLASAKFLVMQTFFDSEVGRNQRQRYFPWPYTEALTLAEATNELALIVTGAYGAPMAKQYGSPLRLAVPWKYGFKHIKSIVRFMFAENRPKTFWEEIGPTEYGFWANVNPEFSHPRWSQASERELGTGDRVATKLYNGYGEFVAHLYADLPQDRRLFM
ncbi:MAG: protein-methionine-sulfoxide reductase catalytic subunit MsrP [Alphaproteobacteria bacterium]|jgi:sulfoxide reductase catalytic subunit YedY|nr:protein-methionine-sulfoxide reductase catalytic subunit MsrP [Alphaproteobacteria bacterium]MDP6238141.1 protein-methionine-sulfoxide reductase catalytic subunit MsrP [Alphaproteobacteria bacterium]MDP7232618.1 protein-methionine-sulfoxide reductase catalytic subunit MsrP [Alphaproteobacteria bacterium]MDP7488497.1 protein-methionine-sulfoxide reductase catalytic subunit MsrP [Alphaproteobacteria bacterium]